MNVINVSVVVVIDSVSRDLILVNPHVVDKVRMIILHALITDSNDNVRITSTQSPGILNIDISTHSGIAGIAGCRTDSAESGTDVVEAGDHGGQVGLKIKRLHTKDQKSGEHQQEIQGDIGRKTFQC